MRAIVLTGTSDDPLVEVHEIDEPHDEAARLVVKVGAAGITRMEPHWASSWQFADGSSRERPIALGLEYAGRVHSVGPGVRGFTIGQNVFGMTEPYRGGAMAEFVSVDAGHALAVPDGLSFEMASTLPLSGQTAWQALVRYGALQRSQRVLIHGGAGAVGTFAIQIARWIGAHIVVTAAVTDRELCESLGADEVIDFKKERFEKCGGDYDLVFDQIGGDVQERSWALLKRGGRLVTIAGEEKDAPDQTRAHALGVSARFFVVDRNNDELRKLTDLVVFKSIRPVIGERFHWHSAVNAFYEHSHSAGKAVLACSKSL